MSKPIRDELRRLLTFLTLVGALAACASGDEPAAVDEEPGQSRDRQAAPAPAPAVEPAQYLGIHHPPLPAGLEKVGGGLIQREGEDAVAAEYGFAEVREGRARLLWLSGLLERTPEGEPVWEVRDAILLPELSPGEIFTFADCRRGDEPGYAAVIAADRTAERLTRVRRAWRVDFDAEEIQETGGEGVSCENVDVGAP